MKTKKMLVPIDLDNPNKDVNDFLYPVFIENEFVFKGVKYGKIWKHGIISFIGKEISKNDVFARIVDSGNKIDNVKELVSYLDAYIEQVKILPLGSIVSINTKGKQFDLENHGRKPRTRRFGQ
ncbi:hypothetical protein WIW50_14800 [Flavobacteriaceae bacterium 3-367]